MGDGALDYFRIDATDIGAGPASALRVSAGQVERFRIDFSWRRTDNFSALPAFANPLLDEGIIPGQHTYDRSRDIYDATLQLFPGKTLTPILGFTRNMYRGPGTTTYHLGGNDFLLNEGVRAIDDEYRIGLAFNTKLVQGAVTQGYRSFRYTNTVSLVPGAGQGNEDFPILGHTVTADGIDRTTTGKANTPVTNVWIKANPLSLLTLTGSYIRADAERDQRTPGRPTSATSCRFRSPASSPAWTTRFPPRRRRITGGVRRGPTSAWRPAST